MRLQYIFLILIPAFLSCIRDRHEDDSSFSKMKNQTYFLDLDEPELEVLPEMENKRQNRVLSFFKKGDKIFTSIYDGHSWNTDTPVIRNFLDYFGYQRNDTSFRSFSVNGVAYFIICNNEGLDTFKFDSDRWRNIGRYSGFCSHEEPGNTSDIYESMHVVSTGDSVFLSVIKATGIHIYSYKNEKWTLAYQDHDIWKFSEIYQKEKTKNEKDFLVFSGDNFIYFLYKNKNYLYKFSLSEHKMMKMYSLPVGKNNGIYTQGFSTQDGTYLLEKNQDGISTFLVEEKKIRLVSVLHAFPLSTNSPAKEGADSLHMVMQSGTPYLFGKEEGHFYTYVFFKNTWELLVRYKASDSKDGFGSIKKENSYSFSFQDQIHLAIAGDKYLVTFHFEKNRWRKISRVEVDEKVFLHKDMHFLPISTYKSNFVKINTPFDPTKFQPVLAGAYLKKTVSVGFSLSKNNYEMDQEKYELLLRKSNRYRFIGTSKNPSGYLGSGQQGDVFMVQDVVENMVYAAKFIRDQEQGQDFYEIDANLADDVSFYMDFLYRVKTESKFVLVKTYIPGDTLYSLIWSGKLFSSDEGVEMRKELFLFIRKQLDQKILFEDMNASNIVFNSTIRKWVVLDGSGVKSCPSKEECLEYFENHYAMQSPGFRWLYWGASNGKSKEMKKIMNPQIVSFLLQLVEELKHE